MSKLRVALILLVAAAFVGPEVDAAFYRFTYVAKRDGHLTLWRTKDGVRPSPDPAVDQDMLAGDTAWLNENYEDCNDHDLKWTNASSDKKCNFVGHAYSYNTFGDFLVDRPDNLPQYILIDVGDTEIDVSLEMETWSDFLQGSPLPDPAATYSFMGGTCPDLPGYTVTETQSGLSFNGTCEVELVSTLFDGGHKATALDNRGLALLILILLSVALIILWRRRSVATVTG